MVAQGYVHIKTIDANGGEVLGYRPLEADGMDIWSFGGPFSTWGYRFIKCLAEHHFGGEG
jgi:hypothetical protein